MLFDEIYGTLPAIKIDELHPGRQNGLTNMNIDRISRE